MHTWHCGLTPFCVVWGIFGTSSIFKVVRRENGDRAATYLPSTKRWTGKYCTPLHTVCRLPISSIASESLLLDCDNWQLNISKKIDKRCALTHFLSFDRYTACLQPRYRIQQDINKFHIFIFNY